MIIISWLRSFGIKSWIVLEIIFLFYSIPFRHYPRGTPGRGARGSLWFTG